MNQVHSGMEYRCCKCDALCCPPGLGQNFVICPICNRRTDADKAQRKPS